METSISSKREPLSPQNGNLYLLSKLSILVPSQVWDVDRLIRARNPGASFTTTERPNTTWGTLRSITYNPLFQVLILKMLESFFLVFFTADKSANTLKEKIKNFFPGWRAGGGCFQCGGGQPSQEVGDFFFHFFFTKLKNYLLFAG